MTLEHSGKKTWIVTGIVLGFVVLFIGPFVAGMYYKNQAISLEEKIISDKSLIFQSIQGRTDSLDRLIDEAKSSGTAMSPDTMAGLTQSKAQAAAGDIEGSDKTLKAIVETYPDIKKLDQYKATLNDDTLTELMGRRGSYETDVKSYDALTNRLPSSLFLSLVRYENFDSAQS